MARTALARHTGLERPKAAPRRRARRSRAVAQLTVGELIAAAYDTAGGELKEVLKLVGSRQMSQALRRRIVLV